MEERKKDHINLALQSATEAIEKDHRFSYEPMLSAFPKDDYPIITIGGKHMKYPFWISSMTGGTKMAKKINSNLAKAANEFGLGMGLGSCRIILDNEKHLPDFNMRPIIGDSQPFFANMGIAQLEQMVSQNRLKELDDLVSLLKADGLIIHVNPMHEFFQQEGDNLQKRPVEIIREIVSHSDYPVIAKEVGQGMGKESLRALLKLPLEAIEFGAFGGTNFAKVEMMRHEDADNALFGPMAYVGHTAEEMTRMVNHILEEEQARIETQRLIISGGVKSFLDGYYLTSISDMPAMFGMASQFLKYAREDYKALKTFTENQIKGYLVAKAYLRINDPHK
jgi:isopentenyl-diphosphate delta-isomerase